MSARALALASLVCASAFADAGAEPDASVLDAAVPDASVGQGGADRDNPEGDDSAGRTPTFCRSTKDCERGFACQNNRCVFVGYRKADGQGCLFGPVPGALALAALWAARRRNCRPALPRM